MTVCKACAFEKSTGQKIDTSKSKTKWAKEVGCSEGGIRRHLQHTPRIEESTESSGESFRETWTGTQGEMSVVITGEEITKEAILRKFGHDPEKTRIVDSLEETHWMSGGEWNHRYRFRTERKADDLTIEDLPLLYSQINSLDFGPSDWVISNATFHENRALVVVWADIQVGKTGSRGGTPELIKRVKEKREKLADYIVSQRARHAYFLSVGDEVESFENVGAQMFTNDLSFPDQLDLELTFEMEMVTMLAGSHDSVTVAGCSSNHCRWRAGKNVLGKPSDDYGLYLKRQLEKALRLNSSYDHVTFQYPEEWDETMSVDVMGTRVGLMHGHQVSNPNQIEAWWTKQAFGQQAVADASVLLSGHFHTFRAQPMGRDKSGKNRWWIQAPTLDSGSDWYRNLQGSDSDAGMLVFCIDEGGLDLQSLTIL